MAKLVFLAIGISWGTLSLLLCLFPTFGQSALTGRFREPGFRFLFLEGMVLTGLVFVMGTTEFQGFWLWVILGALGIALSMFALGCSTKTRDHIAHAGAQRPLWWFRLAGLMMMSLSVLFGADLILSGMYWG